MCWTCDLFMVVRFPCNPLNSRLNLNYAIRHGKRKKTKLTNRDATTKKYDTRKWPSSHLVAACSPHTKCRHIKKLCGAQTSSNVQLNSGSPTRLMSIATRILEQIDHSVRALNHTVIRPLFRRFPFTEIDK